ncbi:MAG: hypothetical protein MJK15_06990 [Colwellia sp.]|nr:hypothetical protein [Colwellia sp.]
MKLLTTLSASALCFAASINTVQAESVVLFDVSEQCRALETTQGTRYLLPCTLPDKEFTFSVAKASTENNFNNENLIVDFYCESMKPFTFRYQITNNDEVINNQSLAPSANKDDALSTFSLRESKTNYTFKLVSLDSYGGFQAIKPGCQVKVSTTATLVQEDLPIGLATKINLAIWRATQSTTAGWGSYFAYKLRLSNAKDLLESVEMILLETAPKFTTDLADIIDSLKSLLEQCKSSYCNRTVHSEIKQITADSEKKLLGLKSELDNLIESIDNEDPSDNENVEKWTSLRDLIVETLDLEE